MELFDVGVKLMAGYCPAKSKNDNLGVIQDRAVSSLQSVVSNTNSD